MSSLLPIYNDPNQNLMLLQTKWASQLNPLLQNPLSNGIILQNIPLINGDNVINHKLSRAVQGYIIMDQNAAASIYRKVSPMPNLTLVLNSNALVTVNIYVF